MEIYYEILKKIFFIQMNVCCKFFFNNHYLIPGFQTFVRRGCYGSGHWHLASPDRDCLGSESLLVLKNSSHSWLTFWLRGTPVMSISWSKILLKASLRRQNLLTKWHNLKVHLKEKSWLGLSIELNFKTQSMHGNFQNNKISQKHQYTYVSI